MPSRAQARDIRRRTILATIFLLVGAAISIGTARAQLSTTGTRAVPTYEAAGLYWSSPGSNNGTCDLQYRVQGTTAWTQALAMWFDAAANECRGSIVNLAPGTSYEVQMGVNGSYTRGNTFTTWSNTKPVAKTYAIASGSATVNVAESGTESGYVVYDGGGNAVLDAQNAAAYNVHISASYVIVRGMTLKGAQQHGILIDPTVHDVIIEDNDISGWGRTRDGTYGTDMDSGIRAICTNQELTRVTIQRNRIHDPRWPTNSWDTAHPAGAQGVTFSYCGGQNVYRWNDVNGGTNHFNDGMGGEDNYSTTGWPNRDSDVYGNIVQNTWDDGLEIEGGNNNVRVWGNYVNNTGTGISSTLTSVGPLYVFRNVWSRNKFLQNATCDNDSRQPMFKSGSDSTFANGRRYLIHNTMLQATQSGCTYPLGGAAGVGGTGNNALVHNTVSMNNIYHIWKNGNAFYQLGSDNTFQNDMTNAASSPELNNIVATPQYAAGNGWQSESGGQYQLAAGTPGYDQGMRIANFNDRFNGTAPDVGAAEAGDAAMKFGVQGVSAVGTSSGGTTSPPPSSGGSTGTAAITGGMDSSSYTIAAGQSVTFTATISGASGTPTGSVTFQDGGAAISGCASVALSGGQALCTTASLAAGSHAITGAYSGDATYGVGTAGPITETVTTSGSGSITTSSVSIASSKSTTRVGQNVTFTVSVAGNAPTGSVNFLDGATSIAGCAAVPLSSGVARCATKTLAQGVHAVSGAYSGDANNTSGTAGPITQTVR